MRNSNFVNIFNSMSRNNDLQDWKKTARSWEQTELAATDKY